MDVFKMVLEAKEEMTTFYKLSKSKLRKQKKRIECNISYLKSHKDDFIGFVDCSELMLELPELFADVTDEEFAYDTIIMHLSDTLKEIDKNIQRLETGYRESKIFKLVNTINKNRITTEEELSLLEKLKAEVQDNPKYSLQYDEMIQALKENNERLLKEQALKKQKAVVSLKQEMQPKTITNIVVDPKKEKYEKLKNNIQYDEHILNDLGYSNMSENLKYIENFLGNLDDEIKGNKEIYIKVLNILSSFNKLKKEIYINANMINIFMENSEITKMKEMEQQLFQLKGKVKHLEFLIDQGLVDTNVSSPYLAEVNEFYKDSKNIVVFLKEDEEAYMFKDMEDSELLDGSYSAVKATLLAMINQSVIQSHHIKTHIYDSLVIKYRIKTTYAGSGRIAFARIGTKSGAIYDNKSIGLIIVLGAGYGAIAGSQKSEIGERAIRRLLSNQAYIDHIIDLFNKDELTEEEQSERNDLLIDGYNIIKRIDESAKIKKLTL